MAEHELNKIVDDDGEVFNLRDSTKQPTADRVTAWGSTPSDTKYPSEKLVKTSLDAKAPNAPSEVTIATGDKPLIADSSDSNKVKRASISFDTGVTNTFLRRNGTFGKVLYADEGWGGVFRTTLSPFDNYAFKNANCFFGPKPSAIRVEYTNDGGTTWNDYGLTDAQKVDLFSQYGSMSVSCGKSLHVHPGYTPSTTATKDLSNDNIADQRLRITICDSSLANEGTTNSTDRWMYCTLRRIGIYMSTQSAGGGSHCLFERRTSANFKSGTDTWVTVGDYKIQGESGWNSIPCLNDSSENGISFGQIDTQSREVRFTIWSDQLSATPNPSQTGCMRIYKVVAYSENLWTNNSANPNIGNYSSPYTVNPSTGVAHFSKGITSGVAIPVSSGGTGATTKKAAEYAINGGMAQGSGEPQDSYQFVFSRVGSDQSATNGVFIYRTAATIWSWIKGKISSVLGLSESGYSGNAATATTATDYNTSTGTIKTALDGKVDFGLSNNTSNIGNDAPAADCISYWGSDNIPNNHIKMVYNRPGLEATLIFSKRSTYGSIVKYGYADKYVYILRNQNGTWKSSSWEKISAGYADSAGTATTAQNYDTSTGTIKTALAGKSDTSHTHVADANDVTDNSAGSDLSVITDSTELVTTNIGGYSSSDKKLYRRPAGSKIWPWIKSKLATDNYRYNAGVSVFFGTRNYTALQLMANHSGDVGYWNNADNYDLTTLHSGDIVKIRVTVTNMANAHFIIEICLDQTPASGATQIHGETIAVYQADPHEVLDGTNADANNFIIPGSYTIRNVTQITKNWPGSSSGSSDYTNLIVTRIVHNNDASPYASAGQISQQIWWENRYLVRYGSSSWGVWRQLTFQDSSYTAVGSSSLPVYTDGSGKTIAVTASSTMGNFIRSLSAETNIGANEYIAAAGASSGQWRYTFSTLLDWINSKNVIECSPANVGTDHKRIQLGYGTYESGAVGYCCYLVHIFFNFVGGTLAGKGVTVLVSYDWRETTYQSAKCQVLNDNSFSATGYRIVLANFLSDNNTKLHICLGLVNTSAPTTLVGFAFSYCKIMRVACDLNWTESIASDNVGTYNYLIPSTYFMETDTGYKIKVVSYLPTTPDDDTIYFV